MNLEWSHRSHGHLRLSVSLRGLWALLSVDLPHSLVTVAALKWGLRLLCSTPPFALLRPWLGIHLRKRPTQLRVLRLLGWWALPVCDLLAELGHSRTLVSVPLRWTACLPHLTPVAAGELMAFQLTLAVYNVDLELK